MHKVASLNGEFVAAEEAKLDAVSSAAFYGRGIFTTVAVYDGEPFLWDKHLRRLERDADQIGLAAINLDNFENSLIDLLNRNEVENARARITIYDASSSGVWKIGPNDRPTILIVTGDFREATQQRRLTISPFSINSRSPLAGVKSCNYLENLLAFEEARKRGFDEAIRLNERGEVASACMANVFWTIGGSLFTPDLATGCLPGTTREFIMENVECEEVVTGVGALQNADSIFFCSAGLGVRQISTFGENAFEPSDHRILHLLPPKHTKTRMSAS